MSAEPKDQTWTDIHGQWLLLTGHQTLRSSHLKMHRNSLNIDIWDSNGFRPTSRVVDTCEEVGESFWWWQGSYNINVDTVEMSTRSFVPVYCWLLTLDTGSGLSAYVCFNVWLYKQEPHGEITQEWLGMQTPVEVLHSIVDSDIAKGTCSIIKEEGEDWISWSISCAVAMALKSIMGKKLLQGVC